MNPLDKIVYEKIARKDLSFGCVFENPYNDSFGIIISYFKENRQKGINIFEEVNCAIISTLSGRATTTIERTETLKIIGHPILLNDVLNYFVKIFEYPLLYSGFKNYNGSFQGGKLEYFIEEYWDLSKPTYEEQSEECKETIRYLTK